MLLPYLTPGQPLQPLPGVVRDITVVSPGAGQQWLLTVPGGEQWWILACTWNLTTSATVANRFIGYQLEDPDGVVRWRSFGQQAIAASSTGRLTIASAGPVYTAFGAGQLLPLPAMLLQPDWVLRSQLGSGDSGDTLTGIRLSVLSIPIGPEGFVQGRPDEYLSNLISGGDADAPRMA